MSRPAVCACLGFLAALLVEPELSPALRSIAAGVFMLAVLAQSWNVLGGLAGYVSFGQAVFFAAGGYGGALLVPRAHLGVWLALPLATVMTMASGVIVGPLLLRLRGQYFALATLVAVAGTRWKIEEAFQTGKGLTGEPVGRSPAQRVAMLATAILHGASSDPTSSGVLCGPPGWPLP